MYYFTSNQCVIYQKQVTSKKLSEDIGFKTRVTVNDALAVLLLWRMSASPFKTR